MMHSLILHLSLLTDGIGPVTIKKIIESMPYTDAYKDWYNLSCADWMHFYGLSEIIATKLARGLQNQDVLEQEHALIAKHDIEWITIVDDAYPKMLQEIYAPPPVLYWRGKHIVSYDKCLAIVGSRKTNEYGQRVINTFVPVLVDQQWTIVSGGALGADTMAHQATVQANGSTIVVVGSGLLQPYPLSNYTLFERIIAQGGTVVSSFPLQTQARPGNFPARNRIIAGLSSGCLVVQAAKKSGARITAQFALEQGREVFAIPGPINDELSAGCHALIQEGAKLVHNIQDILHEFGEEVMQTDFQSTIKVQQREKESLFTSGVIKSEVPKEKEKQKKEIKHTYPTDSIEAKIIEVCAMPCSIDEVAHAINADLAKVQPLLFNLQLEGIIQQDFTGMWLVK